MAHKKAAGSTRLGRDSQAKRLGVKLFGGQKVESGMILVRQRGTKWHAGQNVARGGDDTLFAMASGVVRFEKKPKRHFTGVAKMATYVNVDPVSK